MIRALAPLSIALVLSACGGARPHAVPALATGSAPEQPMSSGEGYSEDARASSRAPTEAASPPSAAGAAFDDGAPRAESLPRRREAEESRPGLGTEWGESRESRVSSAPFERSDPERPVAMASLFYNDVDGVRAMTRSPFVGVAAHDGIELGGGAVSVRLLDSSGSPLPTYASGARNYVVGDDGDRYVIQIQNHTGQRLESVVSVDGLDVIDGQAGSLQKRGYLVAPWASVEIDGFRRSLQEVAAFRFGSVSRSYAASKGAARNVGVIGVAIFNERGSGVPWFAREVEQRHGADAFPGRFAAPPR